MQRYFSSEKKDNYLILSNNDLYHIKTVMRMKEKSLLEVVYDGSLYISEFIDNKALIKEEVQVKKNKNKITLCIPLLTEQKFSFILQKATELGVSVIIPIITERSVIKFKNDLKKYERWRKICKEASEQSKRMTIPEIKDVTEIKNLKLDGIKFVCSTTTKDNNLKKYDLNQDVTFLVGPEGGLTSNEEEKLIDLNFIPITLGENILRVETVPIVLLGILNYEME